MTHASADGVAAARIASRGPTRRPVPGGRSDGRTSAGTDAGTLCRPCYDGGPVEHSSAMAVKQRACQPTRCDRDADSGLAAGDLLWIVVNNRLSVKSSVRMLSSAEEDATAEALRGIAARGVLQVSACCDGQLCQ